MNVDVRASSGDSVVNCLELIRNSLGGPSGPEKWRAFLIAAHQYNYAPPIGFSTSLE